MSALERGRDAFDQRAWRTARDLLTAADAESPLPNDDLARLAVAAQLCGDDDLSDATRQRLFHQLLDSGDEGAASRTAFLLGMHLMNRGALAQAGAWIGRATDLAGTLEPGCAERGYVLLPQALRALGSGDPAAALERCEEALSIGVACGEADLAAMARLGLGQSMLNLGRIDEGVAVLDQAMVAVVAEEVSPWVSGVVYCGVVEACHNVGDLSRAREWTRALAGWCDSQPDLVPFRGRCLVHRSEILQLDGSWEEATDEAERACAALSDPPGQPPLGAAHYQLAELQRLRGELDAAARSYARASEHGREPQPGLALLRLASGNADAAEATLARVLDEGLLAEQRPRLLAAHVEAAVAAGRRGAAQRSAGELTEMTAVVVEPSLKALAAAARAEVALDAGSANEALPDLRDAARRWGELGAVYEAARTRELIARACTLLGDVDSADLESSMARGVYERLGAVLDLQRIDAELHAGDHAAAGAGVGLTGRELEVLRHVAAGETNRAIAERLFISDKTVARHVANIFTKIGVSTRAAATAYAYDHDLL